MSEMMKRPVSNDVVTSESTIPGGTISWRSILCTKELDDLYQDAVGFL
jgi:hypothetical protein